MVCGMAGAERFNSRLREEATKLGRVSLATYEFQLTPP